MSCGLSNDAMCPSHLFTRGLPVGRSIFANFGALKLVDMSHDPATGRHKGFCFIEYVDVKGAEAALRAMNGFELAGRAIKVRCVFHIGIGSRRCVAVQRPSASAWCSAGSHDMTTEGSRLAH